MTAQILAELFIIAFTHSIAMLFGVVIGRMSMSSEVKRNKILSKVKRNKILEEDNKLLRIRSKVLMRRNR